MTLWVDNYAELGEIRQISFMNYFVILSYAGN
jgi:hypothetical protein